MNSEDWLVGLEGKIIRSIDLLTSVSHSVSKSLTEEPGKEEKLVMVLLPQERLRDVVPAFL